MQDDYMHEKNRKVIKVQNFQYYKWVFRMSPTGYSVPATRYSVNMALAYVLYSLLLS